MPKPRAKTKQRDHRPPPVTTEQREGLRRLRTIENLSPDQWQARHTPREWEKRTVVKPDPKTGKEEVESFLYRRNSIDVRLWAEMSAAQRDAATEIYCGWRVEIGSVRWRNNKFVKQDPGKDDASELEMVRLRHYRQWCAFCNRLGIEKDVAIYVLGYGMSLNEAARNVGKRKTWTSAQFYNGLTAYCDMRGWQMPRGGYIITTSPSDAKQGPVKYEPEKWRE